MYKVTRSKAATDPTIVWEADRTHSTPACDVEIPVNRSPVYIDGKYQERFLRITDRTQPVGEQVTYYRPTVGGR